MLTWRFRNAHWPDAAFFAGGQAILNGLVPGRTPWESERTAGTKGVMGAWSGTAKIMVV